MIRIKNHIPNFITCLNLVCGVMGIVFTFSNLQLSAWLIFAGCIFDFIDGFAARLLKATSPIGKELDSLADVVTFGVLPGLILWQLMEGYIIQARLEGIDLPTEIVLLSLLIPVFSALRLAKFNIDTRQSYGFLGLPTPANAMLFASLPLIIQTGFGSEFINIYVLIGLSLIMPALLVSEIPLFALKFKAFGIKENYFQYTFLLMSLILLLLLKIAAIPCIVLLYIILSLMMKYLKSNQAERKA